jgi:drug/metabolite transporter (DMT)-like permease
VLKPNESRSQTELLWNGVLAGCNFKPKWQEYLEFHREGRRNLTQGKETRVLIWRCGEWDVCGGNGNTIRGILAALSIAIETKRVLLVGPWKRIGFDVLSLFESSQLDWHLDVAGLTCNPTSITYNSTTEHIRGIDDPNIWDKIRSSTVSCLSTTTNVERELKETCCTSCAWNALFRPSAFYQQALAKRMAVFPKRATRTYAAVHFRAGDYQIRARVTPHAGEQKRIEGNAIKETLAAALTCAKNHSPAGTMLILITDSVEAQELTMNESWIESFMPGASVALTTDETGKPFVPTHTEPFRGATEDGILNAWLDQGIIAKAQMVVLTSGTFGESASNMLGDVPLVYRLTDDLACIVNKSKPPGNNYSLIQAIPTSGSSLIQARSSRVVPASPLILVLGRRESYGEKHMLRMPATVFETPSLLEVDVQPHERASTAGIAMLCGIMYSCIGIAWFTFWNVTWKGTTEAIANIRIVLLCLTWCSTSLGMHILNKSVMTVLPAPELIAIIQMAIAASCVGPFTITYLYKTEWQQLRTWMVVPFFFAAMLCSSFYTYEYISLSLLTLIRTLTPMVVLPIERMVMPEGKRPTFSKEILFSLAIMLAGALIYVGGIQDISWVGCAFAVLNLTLAAADRLIQRRLLVSECQGIDSKVCTLMNNVIGMLPVCVLALATGQIRGLINGENKNAWLDPNVIAIVVMSGFVGIGICYIGFECQRAISATSFFVMQNVGKVLTVVAGVVFFGDPIKSRLVVVGLILSLSGSALYSHTQLMEQQKQTQKG